MTMGHCKCCDCGHEWDDYPGALAKKGLRIVRIRDGGRVVEALCPNPIRCDSKYWVFTKNV